MIQFFALAPQKRKKGWLSLDTCGATRGVKLLPALRCKENAPAVANTIQGIAFFFCLSRIILSRQSPRDTQGSRSLLIAKDRRSSSACLVFFFSSFCTTIRRMILAHRQRMFTQFLDCSFCRVGHSPRTVCREERIHPTLECRHSSARNFHLVVEFAGSPVT